MAFWLFQLLNYNIMNKVLWRSYQFLNKHISPRFHVQMHQLAITSYSWFLHLITRSEYYHKIILINHCKICFQSNHNVIEAPYDIFIPKFFVAARVWQQSYIKMVSEQEINLLKLSLQLVATECRFIHGFEGIPSKPCDPVSYLSRDLRKPKPMFNTSASLRLIWSTSWTSDAMFS